MSKWLIILMVILGILLSECIWLLETKQIKDVHIAIPKKGSATWNIEKLRMPVFRGRLISEIFAEEGRSIDGRAVELKKPIIYYYGVGTVTKITGDKGTGELINGELRNLKVWGHMHVERRNANINVE